MLQLLVGVEAVEVGRLEKRAGRPDAGSSVRGIRRRGGSGTPGRPGGRRRRMSRRAERKSRRRPGSHPGARRAPGRPGRAPSRGHPVGRPSRPARRQPPRSGAARRPEAPCGEAPTRASGRQVPSSPPRRRPPGRAVTIPATLPDTGPGRRGRVLSSRALPVRSPGARGHRGFRCSGRARCSRSRAFSLAPSHESHSRAQGQAGQLIDDGTCRLAVRRRLSTRSLKRAWFSA